MFLWFPTQPDSHLYIRGLLIFFLVNLVFCHIITGVYLEFPGKILGSLMYTIISSANNRSLTSSLPICIPLISFCFLIARVRNSNTLLISFGESGQPCLLPDFSWIALSFHLAWRWLLACSILLLLYLVMFLVYLITLYHDGVLDFVKGAFSI